MVAVSAFAANGWTISACGLPAMASSLSGRMRTHGAYVIVFDLP
jgi:hypothetical protein